MISDRIIDNILSQIIILNMVIPILMHFGSLSQFLALQAACHLTKCDMINDIKLFTIGYTVAIFLCNPIRCRIIKAKCIRIYALCL